MSTARESILKATSASESFYRGAGAWRDFPPRGTSNTTTAGTNTTQPTTTTSGALKPPGELGREVSASHEHNSPVSSSNNNNKHGAVRVHPAVLRAQQRGLQAAANCPNRALPRAVYEKALVTTLCYRGMEVVFGLDSSDSDCFGLCARTHLVFQELTLMSDTPVTSLVSCPETGLIVMTHADGLLQTYLPQETDPRKYNFGAFRWWNGPQFRCRELLLLNQSTPNARVQVSLSHNYKILIAQDDQLAVLDVTPVDQEALSASNSSEAQADVLWMTKLPGKVLTAAISGNGYSIALVLKRGFGESEDDEDSADGVHTFERDWDDGSSFSDPTLSSSIPRPAPLRSRSQSVGILFKPGPFLVHSAPVTQLSFRGLGSRTPYHTAGNRGETEANDLLLTYSATDHVARIFSQDQFKPLTDWTTPAHTRVDWVQGIAAFTLGDLETSRQTGAGPGDDGNGDPVAETLGKRSHMHSIPSHAMPYSNAGAWISELTVHGDVAAIRLSRLTYLRRGMDEASPTLLESVSSFLPPIDCPVDDWYAQAIWPAWNPWLSETVKVDDSNNETLRGSAMSFLGLSSGPTSMVGGSFGDSLLGGTQSPPCELRLTLSVQGRLTLLEFRLLGEKASLELESPRRARLSLADMHCLSQSTKSTQQQQQGVTPSDSIQHDLGRLVAQVSNSDKRSVDVIWRRPGTQSYLPATWMPDDVERTGELLASATLFKDESLVPAPVIMPCFQLPSSVPDAIDKVLWWPENAYGGSYLVVSITVGGSVVVFEVPPPWTFLEATMPNQEAFSALREEEEYEEESSVASSNTRTGRDRSEYEVSITPDPDHGLGLRLESQLDGVCAIAGSYKKHPLNGDMLPAEKCGMITLGDELISANGVSLELSNFDEIIGAVRKVGASCRAGNPMTMRFRPNPRKVLSRANSSAANSSLSVESSSRRSIIGVPPEENVAKSDAAASSCNRPKDFFAGVSTGDAPQGSSSSAIVGVFPDAVVAGSASYAMIPWSARLASERNSAQRTSLLAYLDGESVSVSLITLVGSCNESECSKVGSLPFEVKGNLSTMSVFGATETGFHLIVSDAEGGATLGVVTIQEKGSALPSFSMQQYKTFHVGTPGTTIRGHSPKLFATMQTGEGNQRKVTVWSGVPQHGSSSDEVDEFISSDLILEDHESGNQIADLCFLRTGYLDASPTLVVFTLTGATLYAKHGGDLEWTPNIRIRYGGIPGSAPSSGASVVLSRLANMNMFDAFPHLASGMFSLYNSKDETSSLKADWHPDSLLAEICTDAGGAGKALQASVRQAFLWLQSEGHDVTDDAQPSTCVPIDRLLKSSENEVAKEDTGNSLFAPQTAKEKDKDLEDMLKSIRKYISTAAVTGLQSVGGITQKNVEDSLDLAGLPSLVRCLRKEDAQVLWSLGELVVSPPNFRSLDVSGQLFLFAASLLRKVDSTVDRKKVNGSSVDFSHSASMVIQRSKRTNLSLKPIDEPIHIASAGCFAALVSDDQDVLLERCRQSGEKFDWNRIRELRVTFWMRSDAALAKVSEEVGQAIFQNSRDIMECALFFIIAKKMRTLRNLAATDHTESGQKFFKFVTTHDFSSERGRRAAEKNAFSLLRKCKYRIAAAFFLLADPPALKSAVETIVSKLKDIDLAFLVARLMCSSDFPAQGSGSGFSGPGFGGIHGGGGGYASGGLNDDNAPRATATTPFSEWKPKLGISEKNLIVDRILPMSSHDTVITATALLWLGKGTEASWCLSGTLKMTYGKGDTCTLSSSDSVVGAFRPCGLQRSQTAKSDPIKTTNRFIDFVAGPVLLKSFGSSVRPLFAASLTVCTALTASGLELSGMKSLLAFTDPSNVGDPRSGSHDTCDLKAAPGSSIYEQHDETNSQSDTPQTKAAQPGDMKSSIFDDFETPRPQLLKPSLAPSQSGMMASSIFDQFGSPEPRAVQNQSAEMQSSISDKFDAPKPQSAKKQSNANQSGEIQSSIFDQFDAPKPPTVPVQSGAMQSSIFDQFDAPKPQSVKKQSNANKSGEIQSSIFDQFDAPKPPTVPIQTGQMQSSIFDQFDAPRPQPVQQQSSGADHSGEMQSSIFDAFEAPRPVKKLSGDPPVTTTANQSTGAKKGTGNLSKRFQENEKDISFCIKSLSTPQLWKEWRRELLAEAAARRLVREITRILAQFHGDPPKSPIHEFYNYDILVPPGVSGVLQLPCDGPALVKAVTGVLDTLFVHGGVDQQLVVCHALRILGQTHSHRLLLEVVLYNNTGREDLAEGTIRCASRSLMQRCSGFSLGLDGIRHRRNTRSHASSQYVRRQAARLTWQLESCLWLHRGDSLPLSSVALKEAICAVRVGLLIASWNRSFECIQALLQSTPDCPVDDEAGRHLWTSLEVKNPEMRDTEPKNVTSGGWEFLVDCKRSQATEMLRDRPTGCFIIRPHSQDRGVFTLSFKTNLIPTEDSEPERSPGEQTPDTSGDELSDVESSKPNSRSASRLVKKSDVVQHAIIRLSDSGFRCGSFGPFTSLISLLEAVSTSLPFKLRFDKPPSNQIIQDEGSQTSPNAVLFRKLALRHADSLASNPPGVGDKDGIMMHSMPNGQSKADKVSPGESKNPFGLFLELFVLSLLCRQLSGVVSVEYNDTGDAVATDSEGENDEVLEVISQDGASDELSNRLQEPDRILGPFLSWCRAMEVRALPELSPELAHGAYALTQSSVDVTESDDAIEVSASEKLGINKHGGDAILRRLIQKGSGVEFSTLRLVDGGECTVVVLFSKQEAMKWLVQNGFEQDEYAAEARLQTMTDGRYIEPVNLSKLPLKQPVANSEEEVVTYRFVDPWEVEALPSREGETQGASLGRCHFFSFSLGKVALAIESKLRDLGGLSLLELWTSVKGGVTLTKALASVHPPWDRAAGGDLDVGTEKASDSSPFMNSIRQHLYRNALFRRLELPQRFVALIQVELLDLKNLTSPGGSLSLNVYSLLRLKRAGAGALLSNKSRTLDTASTQPVKLSKSSGPNAPASWGSVVRFRFPLPEDVSVDGTSHDKDRENLFRGPPAFLQLSVYERKLLVDHSLGAADVSMDGLWAGGQLEEWVPLRSDKAGITWFTRIRLTLRFELMCLIPGTGNEDLVPSVGLKRIEELSRAGGAAHEDMGKRSVSSPDLISYFESMVY